MSVVLKIQLDKEIRRITVPENELTIQYLAQKCQEKFIEKLGSGKFGFSYRDEDGDKITFDSQEELTQLLNEKKAIKQPTTLYINVEPEGTNTPTHFPHPPRHCPHPFSHAHAFHPEQPQPQPQPQPQQQSQSQTENRSPGVRHYDVVCDSCRQEIFGIRYKCAICPNFDLCEKCEKKESSQEIPTHASEKHLYVMIRRPVMVRETLPLQTISVSESNRRSWFPDLLDVSPSCCEQTVICDGCNTQIQTLRYKCGLCEDFDLCSDCIQLAELKHNTEHSFWLKIVPLRPLEKLPRLSNFYLNRPLFAQLGPILVSTRYLNSLGVSNVEIRTHHGHNHPDRAQNPGDIEIEMDVPVELLAGRGGCPFAQFQKFDEQVVQVKPDTQEPAAQTTVQSSTPVQSQTSVDTPIPTSPPQEPMETSEIKTEVQQTRQDMEVENLDPELFQKAKELEAMGFTDLTTNLSLLKIFDGSVESAVNHLLSGM